MLLIFFGYKENFKSLCLIHMKKVGFEKSLFVEMRRFSNQVESYLSIVQEILLLFMK